MKKALFFSSLFLVIVLFPLSACRRISVPVLTSTVTARLSVTVIPSATVQVPTQTAILSPTRTKTPRAIKSPIPSFTPKPTVEFRPPSKGLKTKGPYLIYPRQYTIFDPWSTDGPRAPVTFTAMDADGSGQVIFTLPDSGYINDLESSFSPDGTRIAYFTGSAGNPASDGHFHLSLHIYQWQNGKDRKVADLLSSDYPGNFQKTADMLEKSDPQRWEGVDLLDSLRSTFLMGIYLAKWSPDGRYLAFAGEMNGPSSDLYIYVLSTGEIRRLSDGPANIEWMRWSPDSRKVFHYSAYNLCEGECGSYHVAQLDGKVWTLNNVENYGGENVFIGWVSDNQMAMYSRTNGPYGPLRYFNIDTGEDVIYFHDSVYAAVYDPVERQWLVADPYPNPEHEAYKAGLYLVDPETKSETWISSNLCTTLGFLDHQDQRFFAYCGEDFDNRTLSVIHRDGTVTEPVDGPIQFVPGARQSPDKKWYVTGDPWAVYGETGPVGAENSYDTRLYGPDWKVNFEFAGYFVKHFIWLPDSTGFYFTVPDRHEPNDLLYYFSLTDHQITLIDDSISRVNYYEDWPYLWAH